MQVDKNRFNGLESSSLPAERLTVICFSHLRWSFIWQRPQHLLSRFSDEANVYVVEEPEFVMVDETARLVIQQMENITVLTPLLPAPERTSWGFNSATNPAIQRLLTQYFQGPDVQEFAVDQVITWYYTPMAQGAEPLGLKPMLVIYDVMDELANFQGAPTEMKEREAAMLAAADLVFTGGPGLHDVKRPFHDNVHCFPSGVDASHFAQPVRSLKVAAERSSGVSRVIGFCGVIDERLDIDLIANIADLRPDWSIVMVGPVVKIDPATLPQRPNVHYPGRCAYADLPGHLSTFDVAILPFALNDSTRFISPTKTLEYLAAGKPVVSTPIRDVFRLYGSVVRFGHDAESFVSAIESTWNESDTDARATQIMTRQLLAEYDWDAIWNRMHALIDGAIDDVYRLRAAMPGSNIHRFPLALDDKAVSGSSYAVGE